MNKKVISLFTGAGGLDWGFHEQGFEFILSNEILQPHLKTYTDHYHIVMLKLDDYTNEKNVGVCGDVHDLLIKSNADIVIGGPPLSRF